MVTRGRKQQGTERSIIVVAGEGHYDRQVLEHLLPALLPSPCPRVVQIKSDVTRLSKAEKQLTPRVDKLRQLANAMAAGQEARLVGVVVHVDFDAVADEKYRAARHRISDELRRAFAPDVSSGLALAVSAMEGWLALFPYAFTCHKQSWKLPPSDCRRDWGTVENAKKDLMRILKQPPYRELHAPEIMSKAVGHPDFAKGPSGRNRSYTDFVDELAAWPALQLPTAQVASTSRRRNKGQR
ncbi:hypothetical protein ACFVW5_00795 [Streptomyces sp. NPDC058232]|uniref:hypothetical protein n=1 Tax=Streptomyces sp. NPDC058232 TaxID=3346393 RepID=UPI0036E8D436